MLALVIAAAHAATAPEQGTPDWLLQPIVIGFSWAALIGAIWDGLKWIAGKAAEAAIIIAKAVKAAAVFTWKGLGFLADKIKAGAVWIVQNAKHVWDWLKNSAWPAIVRAFTVIREFLQKLFKPLWDLVNWAKDSLLWLYGNVIRPLLTTIDILRLVAKLLGELGVEWARKVDLWLADLEKRIWQGFLAVLSYVNLIRDFLGLIFDPLGTLNKALVLWTAYRYFPHLQTLALWVFSPRNPWPDAAALRGPLAPGSYSDSLAGLRLAAIGRDPVVNEAYARDFQRLVRGQETG